MIPIAQLGASDAASIHTVVTDIDDTITTHGMLTAQAYAALQRLHDAGLRVIVTTGRPAGWCDHIARMWPVDAVVGENGGVCYWYDRKQGKLFTRHVYSTERLQANREKVAQVGRDVMAQVPGSALASDQFCRLYDLAIDYCEDVPRLGGGAVSAIVDIMQAAGMTAKVSSIHVNGWFGDYDKLSTSRALMRELYGVDLDAERANFIYAGDSPNDAPMFGAFPLSVGVANVRDFAGQMDALPKYVTRARSGEGFVELCAHLLAMRCSPSCRQATRE